MPDSTNARWDADQQGWVAGTPPESAGGGTPRQLNIPAPVLVFLVVLLVVLAVVAVVGINQDLSAESSASAGESAPAEDEVGAAESPTEEPSGEPSEDGCADDGGGEPCDATESPEPSAAEDPFAEEGVESQAPNGYEPSTDSGWFELNVPEGWQYAGDGAPEEVFYDPDDPRYFIQITSMQDAHASAWAAMNALEAELQGDYEQSGYEDYGGAEVLEEDPPVMQLNYRYDHDTFGRQDVYVRTFRGVDGEIYAVSAEGAADDYVLTEERCEEAVNSFCVSGRDCS